MLSEEQQKELQELIRKLHDKSAELLNLLEGMDNETLAEACCSGLIYDALKESSSDLYVLLGMAKTLLTSTHRALKKGG